MGSGKGSTMRNFIIFCRSPNIVTVIKSRGLRWAGHVVRLEVGRSTFKTLPGKPTGKRPLGRRKHRWEDNIRIDLKIIVIYSWKCVFFGWG